MLCPECRRENPIKKGYCIVCGAELKKHSSLRRSRFLFFLSPFFIIAFFIALMAELGVENALSKGLNLGGNFAVLYFFSATFFWGLGKIFRARILPDSYWHIGLFTVSHFIASAFLSYCVENQFFYESWVNLEPLELQKGRLELLAIIFLPTLFTGFLSLYVRSKLLLGNPFKGLKPGFIFVLRNSLLIIFLVTMILSSGLYATASRENQILMQGNILYELGAGTSAISFIDETLAAKNDFHGLHFLKGKILIESDDAQDITEAISSLERAVELKPENPDYKLRLSFAYDFTGNEKKSLQMASYAVDLKPKSSYMWHQFADLQQKYGKIDEAIFSYKQAVKLGDDHPVLLNNLAYSLLEINKELPLALELARRSVNKLPGLMFNLDTLAWAYYKNSRFNEALEVMDQIFQGRKGATPEIEFHYAMILYQVKSLDEPVKTLEKILTKPGVVTDFNLRKNIEAAIKKIKSAVADTSRKEKDEDKN
jgi:tetratricopeptide (TPR) repeat protein